MRTTHGIAEIMFRERITTIDQGKDSLSVFILRSFVNIFRSDFDELVKDSISDCFDNDDDLVESALLTSLAFFMIPKMTQYITATATSGATKPKPNVRMKQATHLTDHDLANTHWPLNMSSSHSCIKGRNPRMKVTRIVTQKPSI